MEEVEEEEVEEEEKVDGMLVFSSPNDLEYISRGDSVGFNVVGSELMGMEARGVTLFRSGAGDPEKKDFGDSVGDVDPVDSTIVGPLRDGLLQLEDVILVGDVTRSIGGDAGVAMEERELFRTPNEFSGVSEAAINLRGESCESIGDIAAKT